jgi:hypothetical protein
MEAKICPDGTAVGRTGPNCEFGPCASEMPVVGTESWKTSTDTAERVSFKYPEDLSTTYIHAVDWPPTVAVTDGPFSCTEAGSEIARAGKTELRRVVDREYCVTKESEGAAGSTYTMYAYAFEPQTGGNGSVVILTFTLRAPQCANYDDPQKSACEGERETFDIDGVVDRIASTLRFLPAATR